MSERLFVPVKEAAELLGISDDLVYDLVHSGELPCAVFNTKRMVPLKAIELIVETAMDGFDPAALLVTMADAAASSAHVEGAPGPAVPTDEPCASPKDHLAASW